jgi:TetR/AcrR family transcriptional regulator of autoinduction and epiphytic fitness
LNYEGHLSPTAQRVADRAGVSLRTVWTHFQDLEGLLAAAGEHDLLVAATFVELIDPALPVAVRVEQLLAQRVAMFEAMAPPWRAARLQMPFSPELRRHRDDQLRFGREQLAVVFAAELRRSKDPRTVLDALLVASSWSAWESLRTETGLTVRRAQKVMRMWLTAILT